ncbi:MgtC/SapB family protein [Mangrovitalea sediminis]|uniref:MgtC/SapB family protein n=1 Tax=Mangrovitalea sediminis TaxID=1982043 RepID=UPI001D0D78D1|nr:DUF4010 domain-containing protein [Mangrovitalea sediminis]
MNDFAQSLLMDNRALIGLTVALLLGTLIGIQRGWRDRDQEAGQRIAGIRTHALTGLLGGLGSLLAEQFGPWILVSLIASFSLIGIIAYRARVDSVKNYSITGLVGLLLTLMFGALAVLGEIEIAAIAAVVTALILDNKDEIHGLLRKLQAHELDAGLKLLLITVVVLPLLPNRGFGPGEAINPFQLWWMVVLIASISFVGYFAVRVGGAERGILFTGLFAGLSSSTALTLHFARLSRESRELSPLLAAGILMACGTMFPRILILCTAVNRALIPLIIAPVLVMAALLYIPALIIWYRYRHHSVTSPHLQQNPLDLKAALTFGVLLLVVMLAGNWLRDWLGSAGVYLLAASSGISDVDAITLSLGRMTGQGLDLHTAVVGIIIAASVNSLVKATLAATVGQMALARRVTIPLVLAIIGGLAVAWLVPSPALPG